jgi:fructose-bisphosphate aldolase, class II
MQETLTLSSDDRSILESGRRRVAGAVWHLVKSERPRAVELVDAAALRSRGIDELVRAAVFAENEDVRDTARWLIGEVGRQVGIQPASIHDLYMARGRGEVGGFTVPAMNIRAASYDSGRALFSAARELKVGALICEIARSEIGYTDQRPAEYVTVMTAAAIREGWSGPLFVQGDHFQVNAKKYAADPEPEVRAVKDLIREAIHAGFYNIDVDTSTLVDLSRATHEEQQEVNYRLSAELTAYVRKHEPEGVTVSVGGEIGEVGTENSTPEELRAYMDGFARELEHRRKARAASSPGLSKISVQSGHLARRRGPPRRLHRRCRDRLRNAATCSPRSRATSTGSPARCSTAPPRSRRGVRDLPGRGDRGDPPRHQLPEHLLRPPPGELRERMYEHCEHFPTSGRADDTEEQFIYKTRKKTLGVFKKELWELPEETRAGIRAALREQFEFLFRKLAVVDTAEMVPAREARPPSASGPTAMRTRRRRTTGTSPTEVPLHRRRARITAGALSAPAVRIGNGTCFRKQWRTASRHSEAPLPISVYPPAPRGAITGPNSSPHTSRGRE